MSTNMIPRLQPIEGIEVIWPAINANIDTATPAAFSTAGQGRFGAAISCWAGSAGAAGVMNQRQEHVGGLLTGGSRQVDTIRAMPALTKSLITSPTLTQPEWLRVWRAQVYFSFVSANPTSATGLCVLMGNNNGLLPTYPSAIGNGAGFGVQGDGAGGIQWFSKPTIAGGFVDVTPLVINAPITEVNVFDFEIRGATLAADASVRLLINGVQVISRSWGVGTVLPTYALASTMNHMRIAANGGGVESVFVGPTHVMAGRFTSENLELLNAMNGSL
jgi:hypothetical protein